jgi:hypothetical protein
VSSDGHSVEKEKIRRCRQYTMNMSQLFKGMGRGDSHHHPNFWQIRLRSTEILFSSSTIFCMHASKSDHFLFFFLSQKMSRMPFEKFNKSY